MEDGHSKTTEEVLDFFGTDAEKGLTASQVTSFQAKYGLNGKFLEIMQFNCSNKKKRRWI